MAISPTSSSRCCSKYVFSRVPAAELDRCWEDILSALIRSCLRIEGGSVCKSERRDLAIRRFDSGRDEGGVMGVKVVCCGAG